MREKQRVMQVQIFANARPSSRLSLSCENSLPKSTAFARQNYSFLANPPNKSPQYFTFAKTSPLASAAQPLRPVRLPMPPLPSSSKSNTRLRSSMPNVAAPHLCCSLLQRPENHPHALQSRPHNGLIPSIWVYPCCDGIRT